MNRANKNKCDIHFFTDFDEYEFIKRTVFAEGISIAESTRDLWFPPGWEKALAKQRKRHRESGIPDKKFRHKKQIEQEQDRGKK